MLQRWCDKCKFIFWFYYNILFYDSVVSFAEFIDAALNKIRLIVREKIKAEMTTSEARMKEYIDLKLDNEMNASFDSINRNLDRIQIML